MKKITLALIALFIINLGYAQEGNNYLLRADKVFDGEAMHNGWVVITKGEIIDYAGPEKGAPKAASASSPPMNSSRLCAPSR